MKTEYITFYIDDYNASTYNCLIISPAELKTLLEKLPENIDLELDEEKMKQSGRSIYEMTAHGKEPLGDIEAFLHEAINASYEEKPDDMGYDTDADGNGYNTIYIAIEDTEGEPIEEPTEEDTLAETSE